jgi:hypothetical protein
VIQCATVQSCTAPNMTRNVQRHRSTATWLGHHRTLARMSPLLYIHAFIRVLTLLCSSFHTTNSPGMCTENSERPSRLSDRARGGHILSSCCCCHSCHWGSRNRVQRLNSCQSCRRYHVGAWPQAACRWHAAAAGNRHRVHRSAMGVHQT